MLSSSRLVEAALNQTLTAAQIKKYGLARIIVNRFVRVTSRYMLDEDVALSILITSAYKLASQFDPDRIKTFGKLALKVIDQQVVNHLRQESRYSLLRAETAALNHPSCLERDLVAHRRPSVQRLAIEMGDRIRRYHARCEDVAERAERDRFATGLYHVARVTVFHQVTRLKGQNRDIALLTAFGWVPSSRALNRLWAEDQHVFDRFILPKRRLCAPEVWGGNSVAHAMSVSPSTVSRCKARLRKQLFEAIEESGIRWGILFRRSEAGGDDSDRS